MDDRNLTPAVCPNHHPINMWGSPLMVERGKLVTMWSRPVKCGECGEQLQGGY